MPVSTKDRTAARQYAEALLELANEQQQAQAIDRELQSLKEAIEADPMFGLFLSSPAIGKADRWRAVESSLKGQVSPLVMNLLGVLNGRGKLGRAVAVAEEYLDLLNEQLGKIEVDLTVASAFDGPALEQVRQRIGAALKKDPVIRQKVDESILGGFVVRVEDKVMDASVKSQIEAMKRKMMEAAPSK